MECCGAHSSLNLLFLYSRQRSTVTGTINREEIIQRSLTIVDNLCKYFVNFSLHHRVQTDPASYPRGTTSSFPGGKAAGSWSWSFTSSYFRVREYVELYFHSPNMPSWHGAQLQKKKKSTGIILRYLIVHCLRYIWSALLCSIFQVEVVIILGYFMFKITGDSWDTV
jgi:hypothetical protein